MRSNYKKKARANNDNSISFEDNRSFKNENASNIKKGNQCIKNYQSFAKLYKINNFRIYSRNYQSSGDILESSKVNYMKNEKNSQLNQIAENNDSEKENKESLEENNKKDKFQSPNKKVSNEDNDKKLNNTINAIKSKRYYKSNNLSKNLEKLGKDENKDKYETQTFKNTEYIKNSEISINKMDNMDNRCPKKIKQILHSKIKHNKEIENSKIDNESFYLNKDSNNIFHNINEKLKGYKEDNSKIKNSNNLTKPLEINNKINSELQQYKIDLNKISKENKTIKKEKDFLLIKLKKRIQDYKNIDEKLSKLNNDYKILKKENDNLKIENKNLLNNDDYIKSLFKKINHLKNENEELKKKLIDGDGINSNKVNKYFSFLKIEKQNCLEEILNKNTINYKNNNKNINYYKLKENILIDNKKLKKYKVSQNENNKIKENNNIIRENQFTIYNKNNKLIDEILDINNKYFEDILNGSQLKMEYDNLKEQFDNLTKEYNDLKEENNQYEKELNKATKNKIISKNKTDKNNFKNKSNTSINYTFNNNFDEKRNENMNYLFSTKNVHENNSISYMNSTIQMLIHDSELAIYFLNEYPKDSLVLKQRNINNSTEGKISAAFYNIIENLYEYIDDKDNKNSINSNIFINPKYLNANSLYLEEFKKEIISNYPKLENFNSKNFILYLLQIMHEELNLYGDYIPKNQNLNQSNKLDIYKEFNSIYKRSNYSIFSKIFYGTYEYTIKCNLCKNITYNYQKFEFISFDISSYDQKTFNIYNGFQNNEKIELIKGGNKIFCNKCSKVNDAENYRKIIEAPSKLIINIDYVNNIKPSKIEFDEIIDITKYSNSRFPLKYRIISVCTFINNNYIGYFLNKENKKWFRLNDSSFFECKKKDIYSGNPYLLLYEKLE